MLDDLHCEAFDKIKEKKYKLFSSKTKYTPHSGIQWDESFILIKDKN